MRTPWSHLLSREIQSCLPEAYTHQSRKFVKTDSSTHCERVPAYRSLPVCQDPACWPHFTPRVRDPSASRPGPVSVQARRRGSPPQPTKEGTEEELPEHRGDKYSKGRSQGGQERRQRSRPRAATTVDARALTIRIRTRLPDRTAAADGGCSRISVCALGATSRDGHERDGV